MKIAVVTDDAKTISPHFGRAAKYAVYTLDGQQIVGYELRDKVGHREFQEEGLDHDHDHDHAHGHGMGRHSAHKHERMLATISDCQVVVARGMGQGAYLGMMQTGIQPILTDIKDIDSAVKAIVEGTIEDHPERLH